MFMLLYARFVYARFERLATRRGTRRKSVVFALPLLLATVSLILCNAPEDVQITLGVFGVGQVMGGEGFKIT